VYYCSNLANNLELGEYGSRMTVLDGKNRAPFLNDAMFSIDVSTNFTESAYINRKFHVFLQILLSLSLHYFISYKVKYINQSQWNLI
jgi:hypothetical protein